MRLALLTLLVGVLSSAQELSEAEEIVKNRDLGAAWKIATMYEVADVLINHLCDEFPELIPRTDKEMIKLKSQTSLILGDIDHYAHYSVSEWEKLLEDEFSLYSFVAAKVKQLRKVGKRYFAKLGEDEKKEFKNEDAFLLFHLEEPVRHLLQAKMDSYAERGLTQEQIRAEIDKKDFEYAEVWLADDPYLQEEKAERIEKEDHEIDWDAFDSQEWQKLLSEVSSMNEVFEYVVNHLVAKYPELHPGSEDKLIALKRELTLFYLLDSSDKMKFVARAQSSSTADPDFPICAVFLKKFMKIGKNLKPLNEAEEAFKESQQDLYAAYKMAFNPFIKHLEEKKAFYKKSGMGERLIKKHRGSTVLRLTEIWHKDDPEIEVEKKRLRKHYGLDHHEL